MLRTTHAVQPISGYTGGVDMSCTGLPANTQCSFVPATLAFTGTNLAPQTVTLTITDDGTRWSARTAGNGSTLPALRAQANQVGATVATESAPGETRLIWRAPLRSLRNGVPSR